MPSLNNIEKVMEEIVLTDENNADSSKSILEKVLGEISKTSPTKQMMIGISSGWIGGFLAMKIGKSTVMALGGGIILLQMASEKGFIKVNWDKVNEKIDKVEDIVSHKQLTWVDKIVKFGEKNTKFSCGFLGGFLIGLASH